MHTAKLGQNRCIWENNYKAYQTQVFVNQTISWYVPLERAHRARPKMSLTGRVSRFEKSGVVVEVVRIFFIQKLILTLI